MFSPVHAVTYSVKAVKGKKQERHEWTWKLNLDVCLNFKTNLPDLSTVFMMCIHVRAIMGCAVEQKEFRVTEYINISLLISMMFTKALLDF